ncbi:hypothetical protein DCAR_0935336 [Daucus carota subsp. sativus]|uniref:Uncharacterized protein n=1 Tax=Daucus carota subsp. sativus TaxID=79200 RepID=A0AAF0XXF0_DAUCS|nr:hypothetical protein DCAR_0935336 [Daucus carota subsp. sativus]
MKSHGIWSVSRNPVKFRIPTADNFVPVRLDIEIDGQRFRDAFTCNPSDTDSEVVAFAKRTVKDLKLPPAFATQILTESYEGQDMYTGEKIVLVKDLNNFESDPEEFARSFCKDVGIDDPEVGSSFWPEIAFAIWEHIYKIAVQNVFSARESRISTKGRRGFEHSLPSKAGGTALDLMKLFGFRSTDILSKEEVAALEAREEKNA